MFCYRIRERHKTQKNKHVLALKRMLYYKSTANNAGLVLEVVNKAHERTLKEALIVYGTALRLAEAGKLPVVSFKLFKYGSSLFLLVKLPLIDCEVSVRRTTTCLPIKLYAFRYHICRWKTMERSIKTISTLPIFNLMDFFGNV